MSVSINSAAARNERIAMSPRVGGLTTWPEASLLAISPAPTVAVPASSPFFINERRFVGRFNLSVTTFFKVVLLIRATGQGRGIRDIFAPEQEYSTFYGILRNGEKFDNNFTVSLNRSYTRFLAHSRR